jgi:tRNA(Ile)-lysidine synthase
MPDFETQLAQAWPPDVRAGVTTLVAVSGGADSVALLRGLAATQAAGGALIVAHFNHRLRGADSEADATFVRRLADQLRLPALVGHSVGGPAARAGRSIEEPARAERYKFLAEAAGECGARYLATAHTADDQAETILHRIVRGTGLAGLAGIPRVRRLTEACTLIRPLLWATRRDVLAYLEQLGQEYQIDLTNAELDATRNRIRHQLLPQLAEYNPRVRESLLALGSLAGEAQELIDTRVAQLRERAVVRCTAEQIELACDVLAAEPRYLVRELLVQTWRDQGWPEQSMGFDEWQRMAEMVLATANAPRKQVFPGSISCARQKDTLVLTREAR